MLQSIFLFFGGVVFGAWLCLEFVVPLIDRYSGGSDEK